MKIAIVFVLVSALTGCYGMADCLGPPPGTASPNTPVDPEAYRVDPNLFPTFYLSKAFSPPGGTSEYSPSFASQYPMVDILPSDEWRVRNVAGNLLLIQSESYERRQCEFRKIARGCGPYLHAIFIESDGRVAGGWKLLDNPKIVVLSSERRTFLVPPTWGNDGWQSVRFEKK